jgi:hypothetical protein
MPIRFRCAYCNQLMGIARRKAGNVVRCPTCAGQVIVPTPGNAVPAPPQPNNPPAPAANLFEQGDFEQDVLKQQQSLAARGSGRLGGSAAHLAAGKSRDDAIDVEPVSVPLMMGREAQETGLHLSATATVLAGIGVLVLMALTFFVGLVVGRMVGSG